MINWDEIETVFLDMDGTLLDLHYDNYFWQELLPATWAEKHNISTEQARATLMPKLMSKKGTLSWYCIDYWSDELAHRKLIDVKIAKTGISRFFSQIVSAHDLGLPKEDTGFWHRLTEVCEFNNGSTVLFDDNLEVLHSARSFGIRHLYAIATPDSQRPPRESEDFICIESFDSVM